MEGSIEVQVDFIINCDVAIVSNLQIHCNFETGLPNSPTLEQYNDKYYLVSHYTNPIGKKIMERTIGNKFADEVIEQILELMNKI
jgi:hypothetical protein